MSTTRRRDPRAERILRNRLHPLHLTLQLQHSGVAEWLGPNGVKRRNPHLVGFIGPNGVRRIDRSGAQSAASQTQMHVTEQDTRRTVQLDHPDHYITVIPDMTGGRLSAADKDLLGLAQRLAAEKPNTAVLVVVFGESKETQLGEAGADRVLTVADPLFQQYSPEQRLAWLLALEQALQPDYWLLPDSGLGGGDLGRRLAVALNVRAATGLWQVNLDGDMPTCVCRAAAATQDLLRDLPRVLLALPECAEPVSETRHAALELDIPVSPAAVIPAIEDLGAVAVDPASVALAEAEFILSGGNGVRDWPGFHQAARALGATEGASRVAVDDGFMPRDRQVGATGTWVTARVYLAVGISGAIQHLQGIQSCEKVISINTDPGCDMVKRADLAVIGDAAEILQALTEKVGQLKQEVRDVA